MKIHKLFPELLSFFYGMLYRLIKMSELSFICARKVDGD